MEQTYFYQYSHAEDRGMIHTVIENGFDYRGETSASSWLAAKDALGFELTPLQLHLLQQQRPY